MCPICISAAALATMAGTGSAGGLAAFAAVKLRIRRHPKTDRTSPKLPKLNLQPHKAGDDK